MPARLFQVSRARRPQVADFRPRFKLWLSSEEAKGGFGDGKWRLLKAIEREGSLKAATDSLGISYRKAWGDLKKAERALGIKLIEKHRGGSGGGETHLTEAGKKWMAAYGRFRSKIEKTVAKEFEAQIVRKCK